MYTQFFKIFIFILISSGCSDWLELKPIDDLVQDDFWQTKEDVEAILMGAYAKFASMDEDLFIYGEIRGDMIEPENATNRQSDLMRENILPTNRYCRWSNFYQVINYCNYVIEFANIVKERDPTFTTFRMEGYKSEAYFLRSLSYFYLVRIFKEVPFVTRSSQTDNQDFFISKYADTTILREITEDLIDARIYATENYPEHIDNRGRATKQAFNALLADISLWRFNYSDVITYCDQIINSNKYFLLNGSQWYSIYYPGNSLESIMEFQFDQGLGQENNTYELTIEDKRFRASIYAQDLLRVSEQIRKNGSYRPTDFLIWKYAGTQADALTSRSAAERRNANWILYRLADIILMKAEALNQLGQEDQAVELVNQIRRRALIPSVTKPGSTNDIEDLILEERARELAFEGKRYFDLVRMGRRNDYARMSTFIERLIQNVNPSQRFVLSTKLTDPYSWYLPVHIDELEANINLEQNPFYKSFTDF